MSWNVIWTCENNSTQSQNTYNNSHNYSRSCSQILTVNGVFKTMLQITDSTLTNPHAMDFGWKHCFLIRFKEHFYRALFALHYFDRKKRSSIDKQSPSNFVASRKRRSNPRTSKNLTDCISI
jgi:hypothetical protein